MDDIANAGTVVQWIDWGNPWHGVVVNTTLTLSDSSTKTVPAPNTGASFLLRVPGAPGPSAAEDAVPPPPGGEWRDYVLLYGANNVIYGKEVSTHAVSWIFVRPSDGSRWLIELLQPDSLSIDGWVALNGDPLTLYFRATQFGDLVDAADSDGPVEVEFYVTLSDRGLSNSYGFSMPSVVYIGISDILPDGSKCCLEFYADADPDNTFSGNQRLPYGFFEVTIDPDVFADSTVAMVHDIAAVYGDVTAASENTSAVNIGCGKIEIEHTDVVGARINQIIAAWYVDGALVTINWQIEDFIPAAFTVVTIPANNTCAPYSVSENYSGHSTTSIGSDDYEWLVVDHSFSKISTGTKETYPPPPYSSGSGTVVINETLNGDTVYSTSYGISGCPDFDGTHYTNYYYYDGLPFHKWATQSFNRPVLAAAYIPNWFCRRLSPTLVAVGWGYVDGSSDVITKIEKYFSPLGSVGSLYEPPANTDWRDIMGSGHPVTGEITIGSDGVPRAFV